MPTRTSEPSAASKEQSGSSSAAGGSLANSAPLRQSRIRVSPPTLTSRALMSPYSVSTRWNSPLVPG